jgi:hypothetical protein
MHMYSAKKPKEKIKRITKKNLDNYHPLGQSKNLIINGPSNNHLFGEQR